MPQTTSKQTFEVNCASEAAALATVVKKSECLAARSADVAPLTAVAMQTMGPRSFTPRQIWQHSSKGKQNQLSKCRVRPSPCFEKRLYTLLRRLAPVARR